jgi:hypothetical protein
VLEDLCNRLAVDDGIHHGAGMAYERVLLRHASKKTKTQLIVVANKMLPVFVQHTLWRPRERAWIGGVMHAHDVKRLKAEVEDGIRLAASLGLDAGAINAPFSS